MCRLKSFQILVSALSIAILIALAAIVYRVFFWQRLRIESPVGGAAWAPGKVYPIRWSSSGRIQSVRLEYSTDGKSYQAIGQVLAESGVYAWTVPMIRAPGARVRISSVDNADVKAVSGPFSIGNITSLEVMRLISPEAGAQWPAGSQRTISWTAPGRTEDLSLSYTFGGEYVAIEIVPAQPGAYAWFVPDTPSNNARVRLSSTITSSISATSSIFSIVPAQASLALTSPQGGEIWPVGSTQSIQWTSVDARGDVRLMWSFDGGPARDIGGPVPMSAHTYAWTVEPICKPFSENARITVESLAHPGLSATHPQPFTISTPALRANASVCLQRGRCYVTNDPAISAAGSAYDSGAYRNGTSLTPWLLTGSEAVEGPDQDLALLEFRWALYEPLVCDQLGNGPYELIAILCTGAQCTTSRCQFVYDQQGRVIVSCPPKEPGLPSEWGVALPFPYILTGGLLLGALLIGAGIYLQRRARPVASAE